MGRVQSDREKVTEAARMLTEVIQLVRACEQSELVLPLIGQTIKLREKYYFMQSYMLPKKPGEENS